MIQTVLVAANSEMYNTGQPAALVQALFPAISEDTNKTMVLVKQWLRMLENLRSLEGHVDIRLASQAALPTYADHSVLISETDAAPTCFVKVETLRTSQLGSVQLHQVGKYDIASSIVRMADPPQYVVMKVFEMDKAASSLEDPMRELVIHAKLVNNSKKDSGIVPLLGCLATTDKLFAIFPFVPEGDMFRFLSEMPNRLSERQIRVIMRGMLRGINVCHNNFICHRDISLENFLKNGDNLHLIDFGLSVEMNHVNFGVENTGPVGKTKYMAPELALGRPDIVDGRKLDIWSLGVTLFMLVTQTEPFRVALNVDDRYNALVTKKRMRSVFSTWGVVASNPLLDMLESMLDSNPLQRPTAEELLNHTWMREA